MKRSFTHPSNWVFPRWLNTATSLGWALVNRLEVLGTTRAHQRHCSFPQTWELLSCTLPISSSLRNPSKRDCKGNMEEQRRKHSFLWTGSQRISLSLDRSEFFPPSDLSLLLLDGGQAATILRHRSLEHVIRSYWRIAPSESASEPGAKVRERNNLPFWKTNPKTINCLQPADHRSYVHSFSLNVTLQHWFWRSLRSKWKSCYRSGLPLNVKLQQRPYKSGIKHLSVSTSRVASAQRPHHQLSLPMGAGHVSLPHCSPDTFHSSPTFFFSDCTTRPRDEAGLWGSCSEVWGDQSPNSWCHS